MTDRLGTGLDYLILLMVLGSMVTIAVAEPMVLLGAPILISILLAVAYVLGWMDEQVRGIRIE